MEFDFHQRGCGWTLVSRVEVRLQKENHTHPRLLILTGEWTLEHHLTPSHTIPLSTALYSPNPLDPQGTGSLWTLLLPAPGGHCSETMELWRQLKQAGLVPPGLGPPPRALRGIPPAVRAGQTLMSPEADSKGVREGLLWIWEELVSKGFGGAREVGSWEEE